MEDCAWGDKRWGAWGVVSICKSWARGGHSLERTVKEAPLAASCIQSEMVRT